MHTCDWKQASRVEHPVVGHLHLDMDSPHPELQISIVVDDSPVRDSTPSIFTQGSWIVAPGPHLAGIRTVQELQRRDSASRTGTDPFYSRDGSAHRVGSERMTSRQVLILGCGSVGDARMSPSQMIRLPLKDRQGDEPLHYRTPSTRYTWCTTCLHVLYFWVMNVTWFIGSSPFLLWCLVRLAR